MEIEGSKRESAMAAEAIDKTKQNTTKFMHTHNTQNTKHAGREIRGGGRERQQVLDASGYLGARSIDDAG